MRRNADRDRLYFFLTCLRLYNVFLTCSCCTMPEVPCTLSPALRAFLHRLFLAAYLSTPLFICYRGNKVTASMKCCRLIFLSFWKNPENISVWCRCSFAVLKNRDFAKLSDWRQCWLLCGKCWCIFARPVGSNFEAHVTACETCERSRLKISFAFRGFWSSRASPGRTTGRETR